MSDLLEFYTYDPGILAVYSSLFVLKKNLIWEALTLPQACAYIYIYIYYDIYACPIDRASAFSPRETSRC